MTKLHFLPAHKILGLIHNGSNTVEEITIALLRRIREVNKKINALVWFDEDEILSHAQHADELLLQGGKKKPLLGLPITIKDNIEVCGMTTTGGISGRKHYIPSANATVVQRLIDAGAIILGKTNCPAFCAGYETNNEVYGRTSNPYDLRRTVGSSSGGEAALIAAGGSYVGLGSDSGGSIRWPASFCGISGLVPTFGRVPRTGTIPPYLGFIDTTQIGPMARSVGDLMLILPHIMGPDNWDSRCLPMPYDEPDSIEFEDLRIAYYSENDFATPEAKVAKVIDTAADILTKQGLDVEEKVPSSIRDFSEVIRGLNSFSSNIEKGTAPDIHEFGESVELYPTNILDLAKDWVDRSKGAKGEQAVLGMELYFQSVRWDTYRTSLLQFMKQYDAILCPVSARPAFTHGESNEEGFNGLDLLSYTHPFSLVGLPAVTIPGGSTSKGLPIGIQILTNHATEGLALKLALLLEDELGGWQEPEI